MPPYVLVRTSLMGALGTIENGWSAVRLRSPVEELEDTSGGGWNGKWYIVYMRREGTRA